MKLQAPENCSGATFGEAVVDVPEDGFVVVEDNVVIAALLQHGFVQADEETPEIVAAAKKRVKA